jgi:hypothetical protein
MQTLTRASRKACFCCAILLGLSLGAPLSGCGGGEEADALSAGPQLPIYDYPLDSTLRLNHVQMKGTHNSFHLEPDQSLPEWGYSHAPLDQQLGTQGVRHFELDIHFNIEDETFSVYHIGLVDDRTMCTRFTDCLAALRSWSDAFPAHHTIIVGLDAKDAFREELARVFWERLEADILSVWPRERLITPDDVKGGAESVRDALTAEGWPTLGDGRARLLLFFMNSGGHVAYYTHGGRDLDGRLMFVNSDVDTPMPYDAMYNIDDPIDGARKIESAVKAGFIVRTRADGDVVEPRAGDTTRREAAFASGAQLVSTDFPAPVSGVDYVVEIPDGTPSRCNPLTAPPECTSEAIEDPEFIANP